MKIVTVVTDPAHFSGFRVLQAGLLRFGLADQFVVVSRHDPDIRRLCSHGRHLECEHPRTEDPYFDKLILGKGWEHFDEDDLLMYVDYDHYVFDRVPTLSADGAVLVSSEFEGCTDGDACRKCQGYLAWHPNTSIMVGTKRQLAKVGREWRGAYDDLLNCDQRHREEVAFGVAAQRAGVTISRVSPLIQANWQTCSVSGSLFHYGGPDHRADVVRRFLRGRQAAHSAGPETATDADVGELIELLARCS